MMNAVCLVTLGKLYYDMGKSGDWMLMTFAVAAFLASIVTHFGKAE